MRNDTSAPNPEVVRFRTASGHSSFPVPPPAILSAVQHIHRMRGGAQSQLLLGSDSRCWVVKFQNNPQHLRILANEWIVSALARTIGLSVPETGIVNVDAWLIDSSPDLLMRGPEGVLAPAACGQQFASLYAGGLMPRLVWDHLPQAELRRVVNLRQFAGMLLIDKWTGNCDARQAVFVRRNGAKLYKVVFIDHGHCFNAGSWTFLDLPRAGVYVRKEVYSHITGWDSFEPWLSLIRGISMKKLRECTEGLPAEWYDGRMDILEGLLERLHRRKAMIEMLIHQYRLSDADPFPNWKPSVGARGKPMDVTGLNPSQTDLRLPAQCA